MALTSGVPRGWTESFKTPLIHSKTTNKNMNRYFIFDGMLWDAWNVVKTPKKPETKSPEHYRSIPVCLQQNWCRAQDWLEGELDIKYCWCIHCHMTFGSSVEYHFFRRYKLCNDCLSRLLVEYKKRKSENTFEEFIEHQKIMNALTQYN